MTTIPEASKKMCKCGHIRGYHSGEGQGIPFCHKNECECMCFKEVA